MADGALGNLPFAALRHGGRYLVMGIYSGHGTVPLDVIRVIHGLGLHPQRA